MDDISLYFQHYASEEEVIEKWSRRLERFNADNLYIIMVERDGCSYDDLVEFDKLPFNNKVVLTHKDYPEIESAFYIKGYENDGELPATLIDINPTTGLRYYEDFDYVSWLNQGKVSTW